VDPLALRVAKRFGQMMASVEVIDDEQLEELEPEDRERWKGYTFSLTHNHWTKEEVEADEDEARDSKFEKGGPFITLEALCKTLDGFTWNQWIDKSSGHIESKEKKDRKGGKSQTDLILDRVDGKRLGYEETSYLTSRLKLKR
jgi:hypothetical protein